MAVKSLNELYDYALSFFGTAYQWGGGHDTPLGFNYGFDCSGFVRKLITYSGLSLAGDYTADDYYHYFLGNGFLNTFGLGSLVFFGSTLKIHHIGFCLDAKIFISSANGGSHVTTPEIARRLNANIKIEPIHLRSDFVCCIMPFYELQLGK